MKDLKEIRFTVKKTEYCEVVMNEEKGWDMPETLSDLVDKVIEIKNDPEMFAEGEMFLGDEYEIINDIEFIEVDDG